MKMKAKAPFTQNDWAHWLDTLIETGESDVNRLGDLDIYQMRATKDINNSIRRLKNKYENGN